MQKENASITLVNESDDNTLTGKIKTLLEDKLNFKNVSVSYSNSKITRDSTLIYDQTNGAKLFTLDELIKKLPGKLGQNNNDIMDMPNKSDFVVVLGNDLAKSYGFSEDSLQDYQNAPDSQDTFQMIQN